MPDKNVNVKKHRRTRPKTEKISDPQIRAGHEGVKILGGGDPRATRDATKGVSIVKRSR